MAAFLANFRCGTKAAGAQVLTLELVVSTPMGKTAPTSVNGLGTITQATSPPLDLRTNISGVVHSLNGPIVTVAMTGTAGGHQNFQGVLVLPNGWGKAGSVSYSYLRDGEQIFVGPVDAEPIEAQRAA